MRAPDLVIKLADGSLYIERWHIVVRNRFFNIYLHKTQADDYRVLHDHPWPNVSIILWGGYWETTPIDKHATDNVYYRGHITRFRGPGTILWRRATDSHRLSIRADGKKRKVCWSLFITGPVKRMWGFHTKLGWRPHTDLVTIKNGVSQMTEEGLKLLL